MGTPRQAGDVSLAAALCRYLPDGTASVFLGLSYTACLSQGDDILLYARSRADARLLAAVLTGREWAEVSERTTAGRAAASCLLVCDLGEGLPVPVLALPEPAQANGKALAVLAADVMRAAYDRLYAVMPGTAFPQRADAADGDAACMPPQAVKVSDGEAPDTFPPSLAEEERRLLTALAALLREDWPNFRRQSAKQLAASFGKAYRIPSLYRGALQTYTARAQQWLAYDEKYPQLVRAAAGGEAQRAAFARTYNAAHMSTAERFRRRVQKDAAAMTAQAAIPARAPMPAAAAAGGERQPGPASSDAVLAQACAVLPELDTRSLPDAYLALAALAVIRAGRSAEEQLTGEGLSSFFEAMAARWQAVWDDAKGADAEGQGPDWQALLPIARRQPQLFWQRALAAKHDFDEAGWPELQETLQATQTAWEAGKLRLTASGCEPGWRARRECCEQALAQMTCALLVPAAPKGGMAPAAADRSWPARSCLACLRYPEQAARLAADGRELLEALPAAAPASRQPGTPAGIAGGRLSVEALPQENTADLPRLGVYDVADGMHLLLAVCWDEAAGRALAAGLTKIKRREHRLAYLSERRENELRACRAELPPALCLQEGSGHPDWTLYEEMEAFIRARMETSRHMPAEWEDRYLATCPLGRESRRAVRRLFRLVWGRLAYEAHYEPLQAETDEEKRASSSDHAYFAVARGWETGLFRTAEEARRASEGFPHALSCEFTSKGTAEAWLLACGWPRGETIRYAVCRKGRQFTVEALDAARVSTVAGRGLQVLYTGRELDDVLAWLSARRQEELARAAARETAQPAPSMPAAHAALPGHGPLSPAMMTPAAPAAPGAKAASAPADASRGDHPAAKADTAFAGPGREALHDGTPRRDFATAGDGGKKPGQGLFRGIQFDKHIFRHVPRAYQERFRKSFLPRLRKMERIFTGERQAAGNDFKLVAGARGKRVFKRRIGDHRLSMVYQDGILTLLALSSHDRQMVDIRKIRGKSIGYVYYDVDDFLQQLESWQAVHERDKALSFGEYLATPQHFVYDEVQQSLLAEGRQAEAASNLSIVGNAGAGKSVVGLKWIQDEWQRPGHRCLYLTMSENLVYTLAYEFRQEVMRPDAPQQPDGEPVIMTTFAFLRQHVKERYPRLPERCLLNAAQSLTVFRRFWQEQVDWRQFWPAEARGEEEATLLMAWREIHGIIKGAARLPADGDEKAGEGDAREPWLAFLPADEYQQLLMREKKASRRDAFWVRALYRVFAAYQAYLKRHGLLDDNDVASLILRAPATEEAAYTSAFIDECQDLTQRELLAIFKLLCGTRAKRLASDRCQMVQPTYFEESWMRTTLNRLDAMHGRTLPEEACRPRYLRYNYRSSRSIIAFQDMILQHFRKRHILTFKEAELQQIKVPPLTPAGWKPVWILPSEKNRRLFTQDLWRRLEPGSLMPVFAFSHFNAGASAGAGTQGRFGMTAEDTVTDVLSCKGMEYPAVLLCDILSDMAFDPAMAWKYFYVGATRANRGLLIYEENARPGSPSYAFLQEAAEAGLIDCAADLGDTSPYQHQTWLVCLQSRLSAGDQYERLETAERALDFGQYELALKIYLREGSDPDMIAYCRGKVQEDRGDFAAALYSYAAIPAGWSDRGRSRSHGAAALLHQPDIEGPEFVAAFLLARAGAPQLLQEARTAWEEAYGPGDAAFYQALQTALSRYDFAGASLLAWNRQVQQGTGDSLSRIEQARAAVRQLTAQPPATPAADEAAGSPCESAVDPADKAAGSDDSATGQMDQPAQPNETTNETK
ncbi:viroplasmin family protein [uncultured Mitsuokella sp.]|uniref:viroplasmin family protein n=1 Tax=uncultured Mitsuokella sp. TaxID=453120 RepID=UPI002615675E|nr:viroplasmin family protein [uncultured Mitsuokella sp.]